MAIHPESGISKIPSVEYFDAPLSESGLVRPGESHVWYKDLVHDVPKSVRISNSSFDCLIQTNFRAAYKPEFR